MKEINFLSFLERQSELKGSSVNFFKSWFSIKNYYQLYLSDVKFTDLSFGVISSSDKWIYVPLTLFNAKLSFLGMPVQVLSEGFEESKIQKIVKDYILSLKGRYSFTELDAFQRNLFLSSEANGVEDHFQVAELDLIQSEEEIFKNISKGHKSSIKSGQKIMNLEKLDSSNFTLEKFNQYQLFYDQVTNVKKTVDFWEAKKKILLSGEGFLILGYVDGALGATSYFLNGVKDVYYGFGIYNRDMMKSGASLTHWPLYFSILESKKMGYEKFVIGFMQQSETNSKLKAIFDFKRRFSSHSKNESFMTYSFLD